MSGACVHGPATICPLCESLENRCVEHGSTFCPFCTGYAPRSACEHEGRTCYPYSDDLPYEVVIAEHFEAFEALCTFEPDFACHPDLRLVLDSVARTTPRLIATAPLLDRDLAARVRKWDPNVFAWLRCTRSVRSSHPGFDGSGFDHLGKPYTLRLVQNEWSNVGRVLDRDLHREESAHCDP